MLAQKRANGAQGTQGACGMVTILAISGSRRVKSSNTALLRAAQAAKE